MFQGASNLNFSTIFLEIIYDLKNREINSITLKLHIYYYDEIKDVGKYRHIS